MARARRDGAGGIRGLSELIDKHGEAIDADLQHHYRLSVGDVVAGRVTLRRFAVLIDGLPGDGTAQWRHARRNPAEDRKSAPPPDDWWTPERDLLAGISDALAILAWHNTKDATTGRNPPKPIRRPGVDTGEKTFGTPMSATTLLRRLGRT